MKTRNFPMKRLLRQKRAGKTVSEAELQQARSMRTKKNREGKAKIKV